jgi:hypothetical protein
LPKVPLRELHVPAAAWGVGGSSYVFVEIQAFVEICDAELNSEREKK